MEVFDAARKQHQLTLQSRAPERSHPNLTTSASQRPVVLSRSISAPPEYIAQRMGRGNAYQTPVHSVSAVAKSDSSTADQQKKTSGIGGFGWQTTPLEYDEYVSSADQPSFESTTVEDSTRVPSTPHSVSDHPFTSRRQSVLSRKWKDTQSVASSLNSRVQTGATTVTSPSFKRKTSCRQRVCDSCNGVSFEDTKEGVVCIGCGAVQMIPITVSRHCNSCKPMEEVDETVRADFPCSSIPTIMNRPASTMDEANEKKRFFAGYTHTGGVPRGYGQAQHIVNDTSASEFNSASDENRQSVLRGHAMQRNFRSFFTNEESSHFASTEGSDLTGAFYNLLSPALEQHVELEGENLWIRAMNHSKACLDKYESCVKLDPGLEDKGCRRNINQYPARFIALASFEHTLVELQHNMKSSTEHSALFQFGPLDGIQQLLTQVRKHVQQSTQVDSFGRGMVATLIRQLLSEDGESPCPSRFMHPNPPKIAMRGSLASIRADLPISLQYRVQEDDRSSASSPSPSSHSEGLPSRSLSKGDIRRALSVVQRGQLRIANNAKITASKLIAQKELIDAICGHDLLRTASPLPIAGAVLYHCQHATLETMSIGSASSTGMDDDDDLSSARTTTNLQGSPQSQRSLKIQRFAIALQCEPSQFRSIVQAMHPIVLDHLPH